jgi:hypothetical protein|tara:strand:- start:165 stop:467 length:303 start_codon:yes stop_codon:yes gene_type:complete
MDNFNVHSYYKRQYLNEEYSDIKDIKIWFTDRGSFYKAIVDGVDRAEGWYGFRAAQDSLSKLLGYDIFLRNIDDTELEKAANLLKGKGIKLTWSEDMNTD